MISTFALFAKEVIKLQYINSNYTVDIFTFISESLLLYFIICRSVSTSSVISSLSTCIHPGASFPPRTWNHPPWKLNERCSGSGGIGAARIFCRGEAKSEAPNGERQRRDG